MRYQVRLLDQDLPGLTRQLTLSCWNTADEHLRERVSPMVYRQIYRALRAVLDRRLQAFRFCGSSAWCDHCIPKSVLEKEPRHQLYPGERINIFLAGEETPPDQIRTELVAAALRALAKAFPGRHFKGLGHALRERVARTMENRLLAAPLCGETDLCAGNEPYDPWNPFDRR